jgi:hypothetical protein
MNGQYKDISTNPNTESFQLESGKVIPITHVSIPYSIFDDDYENIRQALSEQGVDTHDDGFFFRCLTKSTDTDSFNNYRDRLKRIGFDKPTGTINDMQWAWSEADLTYFYMGSVEVSPENNVSIILKFDPSSVIPAESGDDLVSIGNKYHALLDHMFRSDKGHIPEVLMQSLESVTEIQWT